MTVTIPSPKGNYLEKIKNCSPICEDMANHVHEEIVKRRRKFFYREKEEVKGRGSYNHRSLL